MISRPHGIEIMHFQDLMASRLCTDWVEFVCSLQDRFRTPIHDISIEAMTQEFPLELTKIQELIQGDLGGRKTI